MRRLTPLPHKTRGRTRNQTRGLTLLELVVAIAVLAIGSLAALRTTDQARLAIGGQVPRLLADTAVRNRAQELRLLGPYAVLPGQVRVGPQDIALTAERETTQAGLVKLTITARAQTGEASGLVLYLSPSVGRMQQ